MYLGLGTNLGNKEENLHAALRMINERVGRITSTSSFHETEPWGFLSANSFLNAATCVQTELPPLQVLHITQDIEKGLGRKNKSAGGVYNDRPIDIDLLMYGDKELHTPELTLPHPFMTERLFVMEPLVEIAPETVHPVLHQTMKDILHQLLSKQTLYERD